MLQIRIFYYHSQYFIVHAFKSTLTSSYPCEVLEYRLDRSDAEGCICHYMSEGVDAGKNVHLPKLSECFSNKSEFQTHRSVKMTCSDAGIDIFFSVGSVTWQNLIYNSANLESDRPDRSRTRLIVNYRSIT